MKVIKTNELDAERIVNCPKGGFISNRLLLESDGMGYTMTKTVIPVNGKQFWHYKSHLESCYCVSGKATLTNALTNEEFTIEADTTYVLDKNDPHYFEAHEETILICVFNPPLTGREVHHDDGSYVSKDGFKSPVYEVKRVPIEKVTANDYNPNSVAPPEMALLEVSIWEDGYTQPVVVVYDRENDSYVVVDGFHRYCILRDSKRIHEREQGHLPVVVLNKEIHDRMASTIRHNRARGSHNIELMSVIVSELVEMGKGDAWICKHIGMSKDELLRLKQITGVAALFQNQDFSKSWDAEDFEDAELEAA
jgi:ParB-like chromosome segregation protein Spo0J/quercetin dioxygenase-like cupin family protein